MLCVQNLFIPIGHRTERSEFFILNNLIYVRIMRIWFSDIIFFSYCGEKDLCVGLLNVLTDIIWRITISWRAGDFACKSIRFMQACVTYASTYVLVALSIDRYDAITRPMNFSGSCMYLVYIFYTRYMFPIFHF